MITQEKLNNIHKLPLSDVRLILDECLEALGVVDVPTAIEALNVNRSRVYQIMNNSNSIKIQSHKYLCINQIT